MYFYSSKAFEGEFYKSDEYVDATVIVSSDLFGTVEDYATRLKNALIYFATNYTGSPAYVFGNVEDITGNLGLNSGRTPETVPIALDLQIAFERQSDNPIILTISDKEYSDSFTAAGLAEHIKDLRDAIVESQYGSTALSVEFLPVQISAVVRETKEIPTPPPVPVYTKTLHLYGAKNDIINVYNSNNELVSTCTFESGEDHGDIEIEYTPDENYTFKSTVAVIEGSEYEVNVMLPEDAEQTILVRPEHIVWWFGVIPNFFTDGNQYITTHDNYFTVQFPSNGNNIRIGVNNGRVLDNTKQRTFHSYCKNVVGTTTIECDGCSDATVANDVVVNSPFSHYTDWYIVYFHNIYPHGESLDCYAVWYDEE